MDIILLFNLLVVLGFFNGAVYQYNKLDESIVKYYYLVVAIVSYSILIYLTYVNQLLPFGNQTLLLTILIGTIFLLFWIMYFHTYTDFGLYLGITLGCVGLILLFFKLLYLFVTDSNPYLLYTILAIMGVIIIYALDKYLPKTYNYMNDIIILIWNYIRKTLINIIEFIQMEYRISDSSDLIVFLVLLSILILLLFYTQLFHGIINANKGTLLINHPITLNEETILEYKPTFNYHYAISGWFWFNSNTSKHTWNSILNYGHCPSIFYNSAENKLKFIFMDQNKKQSEIFTLVPDLQKWNHILINVDKGTTDIFINNELVSSIDSVIPINSNKNIIIGANDGMNGGICNLTYFNQNLTIQQIKDLYYYTPKF